MVSEKEASGTFTVESGDQGQDRENIPPIPFGDNDDYNLEAGNDSKAVSGILTRGKWTSGQVSVTDARHMISGGGLFPTGLGVGAVATVDALWLETFWLGLGVRACSCLFLS